MLTNTDFIHRGVRRCRSKRVIVAAASAFITASGIGTALALSASSGSPSPTPDVLAPGQAPVAPFAGSAATGINELAANVPGILHANAAASSGEDGAGTDLNVSVASTTATGADVARATWKTALLVGAIADSYAASHLPAVVGVNAAIVQPDGQETPIPAGLGNVVRNQHFIEPTAADLAAISARASSLGYASDDVTLVRGLQGAVQIVVTTTGADLRARLERGDDLLASLLGTTPNTYEGAYLEVRDASGSPLYINAIASRNGTHTVWIDPALGVEIGNGPHG